MTYDVSTLLDCAQCTFNRFMPTWYLFVLLRLVAFFYVARPRLDTVRVLGVAAVFEVPYFVLWQVSIHTAYQRMDFNKPLIPLEILGSCFTVLFVLGLIHTGLLMTLSQVGFFRVRNAPEFRYRRALLLIPCFLAILFLQFCIASMTSSTGVFEWR